MSIDQWLGKYYCILGRIQTKRGVGEEVWFVQNKVAGGSEVWNDSRKIQQFLFLFMRGDSIFCTLNDT